MGTGLSGGLGGLGAKTSPSAFSVGGSLGGAFAGGVVQQPGPFGGTSGFGAQPQQQQVSNIPLLRLIANYRNKLASFYLETSGRWWNVRRYGGEQPWIRATAGSRWSRWWL